MSRTYQRQRIDDALITAHRLRRPVHGVTCAHMTSHADDVMRSWRWHSAMPSDDGHFIKQAYSVLIMKRVGLNSRYYNVHHRLPDG